MKKILLLIIFATVISCSLAKAQTNTFPATGAAGIGTTTPDTSSLLETKSTAKGILIPLIAKTHTWMYAPNQLKEDSSTYAMNKNNARPVLTNDIPIKARRDFMRSFKDIQNAEWHKIEDGYFARFNQGRIVTEIRYNQDGRWLCNIRTYYEDQLSPSIKNPIKSKYKDYTIVIVQEYECYKGTVWMVSLENKREQILVRIEEGEMREIHHFYTSE